MRTRRRVISTTVNNFQNVDATALSGGVTITGSSSANTVTGGSGNDTIDGAGGADAINASGGADTVTYRGTETSIDGGTGSDTLVLAVSGGTTAVNFSVSAGVDQTTGDSVSVANFESLDASAVGSALTVTGSSAANTITTGSGNDVIDGGGGADAISAGLGNDTVTYRGTESSIDGGGGTNTLVLAAAATVNLANADQTSGDSTTVNNFHHVDASGLSSAVTITGSSSANTLTGGSGADTIDGGGGADTINASGGNDTVTYRGTETSIDGGSGTDLLVMAAGGGVTAINFSVSAGVDQTTGDSVSAVNFESVDASALSSALSVTGSSAANTITTGSGADTIDGGGGADVIDAGGGNDTVTYRASETSIDGGSGTNTLTMATAATVNLANADQTSGDSTVVSNFQNVNAASLSASLSITGSSGANTITTGTGADTIDGGGGADTISAGLGNDTVSYYGSEVSIDGGGGTNTLLLRAAATVDLGNVDQTSGDSTTVNNFSHIDASRRVVGLGAHRLVRRKLDHRRLRRGYDRRRRRRRHHQCRWRERHRHLSRHGDLDRRWQRQRHAFAGVARRHLGHQLRGLRRRTDQTTGDSVSVANFENLAAAGISSAVTVTGSSGANTIATGSGNDTIDGGGGADVIDAGGGSDTVTYHGTETSIDGGAGTNTLVLASATDVNLGNADQTTGNSTNVIELPERQRFGHLLRHLDHGIVVGQHADRRIGQRHDRWRRRRRHDQCRRWQRHRDLSRHRDVDRRRYGKQYARARRRDDGQPRQWRSDLGRFDLCHRLPEHRRLGAVLGPHLDGFVRGQHHHRLIRERHHQWRRRPRSSVRRWRRRHLHHRWIVAGAGRNDRRRRWNQFGQPVGELGHHHGHRAAGVADERAVDRLHREQRQCVAQSLRQPDRSDGRWSGQYADDADQRRGHGDHHRCSGELRCCARPAISRTTRSTTMHLIRTS